MFKKFRREKGLKGVNIEWEKKFGGGNSDEASAVRQTSDGGYILAGKCGGYFSSGDRIAHIVGYDLYLIKTDPDGNKLWEKKFGSSEASDQAYSVQQTSDGGYILAGYTETMMGKRDGYLIKTNKDGNKLWERTFGGRRDEIFYSVQQIRDGGYIMAGRTESRGAGRNDAYLIKTDSNGNMIWEKTFGGGDDDGAYSVQQTRDGGYILAGYTYSKKTDSYDVYLMKVS